LPDDWETSAPSITSGSNYYTANTYTYSEWAVLQSYGAVFLPAAGYRGYSGLEKIGIEGDYWSSSSNSQDRRGGCLVFGDYYVVINNDGTVFYGRAVRLVKDAE
jgi:hypothetical protein